MALSLSVSSLVALAQTDPASRITGKLLDRHQTGISGDEVLVKNSVSGEVLKVSSTADGLFIVAPLVSGVYQLISTKDEFKS